jgi:hypothetical protein
MLLLFEVLLLFVVHFFCLFYFLFLRLIIVVALLLFEGKALLLVCKASASPRNSLLGNGLKDLLQFTVGFRSFHLGFDVCTLFWILLPTLPVLEKGWSDLLFIFKIQSVFVFEVLHDGLAACQIFLWFPRAFPLGVALPFDFIFLYALVGMEVPRWTR